MREEIRLGKEELEKARRCSMALKLFSEINQDLLENVPQQALKKSDWGRKNLKRHEGVQWH